MTAPIRRPTPLVLPSEEELMANPHYRPTYNNYAGTPSSHVFSRGRQIDIVVSFSPEERVFIREITDRHNNSCCVIL